MENINKQRVSERIMGAFGIMGFFPLLTDLFNMYSHSLMCETEEFAFLCVIVFCSDLESVFQTGSLHYFT